MSIRLGQEHLNEFRLLKQASDNNDVLMALNISFFYTSITPQMRDDMWSGVSTFARKLLQNQAKRKQICDDAITQTKYKRITHSG